MKKIICILSIFFILCCSAGCGTANKQPDIELTADQKTCIDLIVQHRDEWKETTEYGWPYPITRAHIYESNGTPLLTVAHAGDSSSGGLVFVGVRGYAVSNGEFTSIGSKHYKDWHVDCVTVDMENMSDEELREALEESYKKHLAKQ